MSPEEKAFDDADVEEFDERDPRDTPTTYTCARCDEEFTRTDREVEDEEQSTEYCDSCITLMAKTSGDIDDNDRDEAEYELVEEEEDDSK
jgi:DNA-directed RNA polymerase subunit RPC12/RpoP